MTQQLNGNAIEMIGQRFGSLVVTSFSHRRNGVFWNCLCDCGNLRIFRGTHLRFHHYRSCGCKKYKHAMTGTRIYKIWCGIKKRCYQAGSKSYPDYGGRGIGMCKPWRDDFLSFFRWATASGYSDSLTIERIDWAGHYEPENCKWITKAEQNLNTRNTRLLTLNGKTQPLATWSKETGIGHSTILYRLKLGWTVEKALTSPAFVGRNQYHA